MASLQQRTFTVIAKKEHELLDSWTRELEASGLYRNVKIEEFRQQTAEFIRLLIEGAGQAESTDLRGSNWEDMRQFLEQLSHSRVLLTHFDHCARRAEARGRCLEYEDVGDAAS